MFLSGIIYIPLTVHYLGPERFGLWVAMTSVVTLLTFADCGLGYGLMNHIAYATGTGEKDSIRKAISSTFFVLCGIALVGCLVLGIAYPFVPWQEAFRASSPNEASEAALAVTVMAASFLLTLPFTTVQRVQSAHQEGFETQVWEIAGVLLSLFGLLAAIRARAGLPVLAIVFSSGPLLAVVLNFLVYFFVRRPSESPAFKLLDLHMARKIIHEGGYFFALQISGALLFSIDSLVILHYFGQAELGKYNLTAKLFQTTPVLVAVWFAPLWPAYAEAIARRDFDWVRRTLLRSTMVASLGCAVVSCGAGLWARPIIRVWTGVDVGPSLWLLTGLAVFSVILVSATAIATYLNGSNFIKGQVKILTAATVLSLVFKILLSKHWNISGAIWGTNLAYLLVVFPAYFVVVPRLLREHGAALQNRASPISLFRLFLKHSSAAFRRRVE